MTHPFRSRSNTLRALTGATVMAAGITACIPVVAQAATPVACSQNALVEAINVANGGGDGDLVLTPGCTYTLTRSNGTGANGPNGLPIIKSVISLSGNNSTIARSNGFLGLLAPSFRIAEVAKNGNLTVKAVTLTNGRTTRSGGGILNFGAVTLTGSALTNNTASGGTGGGLSNADVSAPGTGPAATFTSSTVSGNTASGPGGGIYNGLRATLSTTTSFVKNNRSTGARGGGVAAIDSTATTLTSTPISANRASANAGGVYRLGGDAMTITTSPITGNRPNNCVTSSPPVPDCTA